jgi:hypothetical protein
LKGFGWTYRDQLASGLRVSWHRGLKCQIKLKMASGIA